MFNQRVVGFLCKGVCGIFKAIGLVPNLLAVFRQSHLEIIFLGITLANTFKITHQLIPLPGLFQCFHPPFYSMGLCVGGVTFIRIIHTRIEIAVFQFFIKQRSLLLCEVAFYALAPVFQVFLHQGERLFVPVKFAQGKGSVISGIVNHRLCPTLSKAFLRNFRFPHTDEFLPFGSSLFEFVQRAKNAGAGKKR